VLLAALMAALALAAGCGLGLQPETADAVVARVVDGDTVVVRLGGREETVRLLLVDTPETVHPDKPVEPFGPEASGFAKEKLEGQSVRLEFDGPKRDRYDRLLAYVWVGGMLFNEMLTEHGLARVAYVYDPPYTHYEAIAKAEERARQAKRGIWSIENYVTENGFDAEAASAYWREHGANGEPGQGDPGQGEPGPGEPGSGETAQKPAQEEAGRESPEAPACDNPLIKGNINSRGEKIYHLPGGQYYEQTKPERLFCTVEEAVAAGFRAALR